MTGGPQHKRKVGVYERPASADRPRRIKRLIYAISIVVAILWALYFFGFMT